MVLPRFSVLGYTKVKLVRLPAKSWLLNKLLEHPYKPLPQWLKHANLSLESSHSKHFIYSIKVSQIPYV